MGIPREGIRILLDTAAYLEWADGKRTSEYEELRSLLCRGGARLVFSLGHLIDFHRVGSAETKDRLTRCLEGLPCRFFAMSHAEAEKQTADTYLEGRGGPEYPPDLAFVPYAVAACSAELGFGAGLLGELAPLAAYAGALARRASAQDRFRVPEFEQAFAYAFEHIDDLLPQIAGVPGLADTIREEVARRGRDVANLARAMLRNKGEIGDISWAATRGGAERWEAAAAHSSPGQLLDVVLRKGRAGDARRRPLPSDLADRDHLRLVPYVDVATVDKDNFARVQAALRRIQCRRHVALYRNEDLGEAIAEARRRLEASGRSADR